MSAGARPDAAADVQAGRSAGSLLEDCTVDERGRVLLDGEHIGDLSLRDRMWHASSVVGSELVAISGDQAEVLRALLADPCRPGRLF